MNAKKKYQIVNIWYQIFKGIKIIINEVDILDI